MTTPQNYDQAAAFVHALGGDIMDWRALSDRDAGAEGHARRGTLAEHWQWLCQMNDQQYGVFCTIASMDGYGRKLENVAAIRAHYVDLDNASAMQNYQLASAWNPAPCFAVNTSPNKAHVYWPV